MTNPDPPTYDQLTRQLQAAMIRPLIVIAVDPTNTPTRQNAAIQLASTYNNDLTLAALISLTRYAFPHNEKSTSDLLTTWSLGRSET